MRVCSKCGDCYADPQLAFCLADGTPLVDVAPSSDVWDHAARVIEQKHNTLKAGQRRLKWRRVMLMAMLIATMVVTVVAVNSSISVTVEQPLCIEAFNDLNRDGDQDAGEPGLSSFRFQVSGTGTDSTLTTGSDGRDCAVIPVGTYTVVEQPQGDWISTTETTQRVTVIEGQAAKVVFGYREELRERGELGIRAFNDLNGNRVLEPNEPGLSGFVFQVSGTGPETTLTTGPNGFGSGILPVGAYTVVEQPQSGWTATTQTTQTVTVTAGQAANVLFGSKQEKGKLDIRAFNDLNGNGVLEPNEPGLSGVVFKVNGTGPDTTLTAGANGLAGGILPVGTYTVVEQPRSGWIATTLTTQMVTVTTGPAANMLFGSRREKGKLCITEFDDRNGNGVQDDGEQGLSGFGFQVRGTDPATTLTTDVKGGVCSELTVGTYIVVAQPQGGWIATTPTTPSVTVTTGRDAKVLFGSRQEKGKLCITKFNDLNVNGVRDPGEPGLSGFLFEVRGTDPATTLTTRLKGEICSELTAGTYTVTEQAQGGWIPTTPTTQTVTVTAGRAAIKLFGGRQERVKPGTLCIRKFNDLNGNAVADAGEQSLSGFVFQVREERLATSRTIDIKGGSCSELPVGTYTVVERAPGGWIATTQTTQTVAVTAGETSILAFGSRQEESKQGTLCIIKFNDLNGDGVYDRGEPGLSGFAFQVRGTDHATILTTGLRGDICSALPVGKYSVVETPRLGWTATTATTRTVTITEKQAASLVFGNTNRDYSVPLCSEADKSSEWQIIRNRYDPSWRRMIEGERDRIIAKNVPPGTQGAQARLGPIQYDPRFTRCTSVLVVLRYEWLVQSPKTPPKTVPRELKSGCEKMGGAWVCR